MKINKKIFLLYVFSFANVFSEDQNNDTEKSSLQEIIKEITNKSDGLYKYLGNFNERKEEIQKIYSDIFKNNEGNVGEKINKFIKKATEEMERKNTIENAQNGFLSFVAGRTIIDGLKFKGQRFFGRFSKIFLGMYVFDIIYGRYMRQNSCDKASQNTERILEIVKDNNKKDNN